MKNKNAKPLKLKKIKVLKFYQAETLLGGLANSGCMCNETTEAASPAAPAPRRPIG